MTTIKNVTEEKKKKLKCLDFIVPIRSTTERGGERVKKEKKSEKNLQNKSKHKNNKCFC